MIYLQELQVEQRAWVARNFPNRTKYMPLYGMIEEIGELAHAQLKGEQGIRYTPEMVLAKKRDAVADTIVYLADYCSANGYDLYEITSRIPLVTAPHNPLLLVSYAVGRIAQQHAINEQGGIVVDMTKDNIQRLVVGLKAYCIQYGFDLIDVTRETWGKVKQRDWIKNPVDANKKVEGSI